MGTDARQIATAANDTAGREEIRMAGRGEKLGMIRRVRVGAGAGLSWPRTVGARGMEGPDVNAKLTSCAAARLNVCSTATAVSARANVQLRGDIEDPRARFGVYYRIQPC